MKTSLLSLPKKNISLKNQLILLAASISLILGIIFINISHNLIKLEEKTNLSTFKTHSLNLSNAIGAQFYERYGDVQTFGANPIFQTDQVPEMVKALNKYSALYGIYDLILVVKPDGKLLAVNDQSSKGNKINIEPLYQKDFSRERWFQEALKGAFTNEPGKGFSDTFFEDPQQVDSMISSVYGTSFLSHSFTSVIKDKEGKVIAVISNRCGSHWLESALKEIYDGLKNQGYHHPTINLLNKDGFIIYEYSSELDEKPVEGRYNSNTLLKKNLIQLGDSAAIEVKEKKWGSKVAFNTDTQVENFTGYALVSGAKFIDSIGWSVLVRVPKEEVMEAIHQATTWFYFYLFLEIILVLAVMIYFSTSLSKKLNIMTEQLDKESHDVMKTSEKISQSSSELAEAVQKQAAAIEETAASLEQVSAMIRRSSENTTESQKISQISEKNTKEGQEAVSEMIQSIQRISQSNSAIMTQVEDGNKKISEIVKVIAEIGNKTKVINDIVFQTKLLSFNASVEAARAGEHGKGFAVVAEEVGNLAQMSGNAAKDISSLLEASIEKVESIIEETKTKVESLIVENKAKVEGGTQTANRCNQTLEEIFSTVQKVNHAISEIASASKEQSQGVSEINRAMNQLDQVTHQNSSISIETASAAQGLNKQSKDLKNLVNSLSSLVHGESIQKEKDISDVYPPSEEKLEVKKNSKEIKKLEKNKEMNIQMATQKIPTIIEEKETEKQSMIPSNNDPRFEDV